MNYLDLARLESTAQENTPHKIRSFVKLFDDEEEFKGLESDIALLHIGRTNSSIPYCHALSDAPFIHGYVCRGLIGNTYCYTLIKKD